MHVIEFQGPDAKPVGSKAAGNPVAPISEMLEAKTLLVNNRPVLLEQVHTCSGPPISLNKMLYFGVKNQLGCIVGTSYMPFMYRIGCWSPPVLLYRVQPNEGEKAEIREVASNELRTRLLEFRVELCKSGLEQVRRHLSVRISGGQSTFQHQLVKGMVARHLTTLYMAETLPRTASSQQIQVFHRSGSMRGYIRNWTKPSDRFNVLAAVLVF